MFGCAPNGGAGHLPDVLAKFIRKISFMAKRRIDGAVHDPGRQPFPRSLSGIEPAEFPRAARKGAILIWREMSNADDAA
jgi:hypothetical protein